MNRNILNFLLIGILASIVMMFNGCKKDINTNPIQTDPLPQNEITAEIACLCEDVCTPSSRIGSFVEGTEFSSYAEVSFALDVIKTGSYTITTKTKNGYYLSAEGAFSEIGKQYFDLKLTGTPLVGQKDTFDIKFGENTCKLAITIYKKTITGLDNKIFIYSIVEGFDAYNKVYAVNGYSEGIWGINGYGKSFVAENDVLYLSLDYKITALDINTGNQLWKNETIDGINKIIICNNILYATSDSGKLYAFSSTDGSKLWEYPLSTGVVSSVPTIYNNKLYVGYDQLYVFNLDGTLDWKTNVTGSFYRSCPTIYNDKAYISNGDSLFAFNINTQELIWSYKVGLSLVTTVYNNKIYARGNALYCLDSENGQLVWETDLPVDNLNWPIIEDDILYVSDNYFKAIDAETGSEIWSIIEGYRKAESPIVCESMFVGGIGGGGIYACHAKEKYKMWCASCDGQESYFNNPIASPIGYDIQTKKTYYSTESGMRQ
jgi:outer membrane protein assembly factor BamB